MCGTLHPVGMLVCSTCRAEGVAQLRLMFECQRCGALGLAPQCGTCPRLDPPSPAFEVVPNPLPDAQYHVGSLDLDDELIIAEEIVPETDPKFDFDDIDDAEDERIEDDDDDEPGDVDGSDLDLDDDNHLDDDLDDDELDLDDLDFDDEDSANVELVDEDLLDSDFDDDKES